MKTFLPKVENLEKKWFVVNAEDKVLGRLATEISTIIRGKNRSFYTPFLNCGNYVIVLNAEKIKVTGKKAEDKNYYRYSGYQGGLKTVSFKKMIETKPEDIIIKAVKGMLPKNRISRHILKQLKVYSGSAHPHAAQKPVEINL